jgi:biotin carboxyl carrier protein
MGPHLLFCGPALTNFSAFYAEKIHTQRLPKSILNIMINNGAKGLDVHGSDLSIPSGPNQITFTVTHPSQLRDVHRLFLQKKDDGVVFHVIVNPNIFGQKECDPQKWNSLSSIDDIYDRGPKDAPYVIVASGDRMATAHEFLNEVSANPNHLLHNKVRVLALPIAQRGIQTAWDALKELPPSTVIRFEDSCANFGNLSELIAHFTQENNGRFSRVKTTCPPLSADPYVQRNAESLARLKRDTAQDWEKWGPPKETTQASKRHPDKKTVPITPKMDKDGSGSLAEILVPNGTYVAAGAVIGRYEAEKATHELIAPHAGVIKWAVEAGADISGSQPVAHLSPEVKSEWKIVQHFYKELVKRHPELSIEMPEILGRTGPARRPGHPFHVTLVVDTADTAVAVDLPPLRIPVQTQVTLEKPFMDQVSETLATTFREPAPKGEQDADIIIRVRKKAP